MISYKKKVYLFSIISSYLYIILEWMFFVTKPSLLTGRDAFEKIAVLAIAPIPLVISSLTIILVIQVASRFTVNKRWEELGDKIALAVPTAILVSIVFLLFENFTYTIAGFNISSFDEFGRYVYMAALVVASIWAYSTLDKVLEYKLWIKHFRTINRSVALLLICSISALGIKLIFSVGNSELSISTKIDKLPNIIVLSTDGLNSNHMSAYGYRRTNTPYISTFALDALVSENNFTNAANTAGSIGSLMSGKLPTTTKVIFPPDIFTGKDIFQHLPGILRKLGYINSDISIRHYADASDLNMVGAFDIANSRKTGQGLTRIYRLMPVLYSYSVSMHFLTKSMERLSSRVYHALGIKDMDNQYELVTQRRGLRGTDPSRVRDLKVFVSSAPEPFFAHVHFMQTHGPKFNPIARRYSKEKKQTMNWMDDYYDDAIGDYDNIVKKIITFLKVEEKYHDSIIILTSDHGKERSTHSRLPLIIKFPRNKYKGKIKWNTQRVDIAPTLLDYIGVTIPKWMEGDSLIAGAQSHSRHIFSSHTRTPKQIKGGWFIVESPSAPFYSLGAVSLVVCDKSYKLNLHSGKLTSLVIAGHTAPCDPKKLPTESQAKEILVKHLASKSYDVSSLLSQ